MYFDYVNVLVFASVGLVFVFANMLLGSIIRPKRKHPEGLEPYECGEQTIGDAWIRFDIRYYTVALVYVIFAVEIAFLFPWAIVLKDALNDAGAAAGRGIGVFGLIEGVVFVGVLFLGLAYVWAKGDLDWVMAYSETRYQPSAQRQAPAIPTLAEVEAARAAEVAAQPPPATSEEAA
jgi:NADH-quinone oxidoreductase subunit A